MHFAQYLCQISFETEIAIIDETIGSFRNRQKFGSMTKLQPINQL